MSTTIRLPDELKARIASRSVRHAIGDPNAASAERAPGPGLANFAFAPEAENKEATHTD